MRVLIVSHNVLSRTNNMGKTILSYFSDFHPGEVAQFYIHSEVPTDGSVCENYFRFTDQDALRSLNPFRRFGRVFGKSDIQPDRASPRTDSGLSSDAYRIGQKRTPLVYLLRNLLWKLSRWDTPALRQWVRDFDPDVIFFASGDYSFMYDVAARIADLAGKPLAMVCVDDYYLNDRNAHSLLGPALHRRFLKTVHRTMARTSMIFTICGSMADAYRDLFQKECRVLHTPAPVGQADPVPEASAISYIGNLANGRSHGLISIGRALKALAPQACIDVYAANVDPEILKEMTEENGICFHGAVSAEMVPQIMNRSAAVIHTEGFDETTRALVRFSVSTKIAESLMYGPCIIAYGPDGIASIDYLKENDAAIVITGEEGLEEGLRSFLEDGELRRRILQNARALAHRNHDIRVNSANVRCWLAALCQSGEN